MKINKIIFMHKLLPLRTHIEVEITHKIISYELNKKWEQIDTEILREMV